MNVSFWQCEHQHERTENRELGRQHLLLQTLLLATWTSPKGPYHSVGHTRSTFRISGSGER